MENGKPLSPKEASDYIQAFKTFYIGLTSEAEFEKVGIAQKFDLLKLRNFINAIDNHQKAAEINAVRIYLARSNRGGETDENFDVVLVPVLKEGNDLHELSMPSLPTEKVTTILGESSPCPTVCGRFTLI